jgi:hypothetical protein
MLSSSFHTPSLLAPRYASNLSLFFLFLFFPLSLSLFTVSVLMREMYYPSTHHHCWLPVAQNKGIFLNRACGVYISLQEKIAQLLAVDMCGT